MQLLTASDVKENPVLVRKIKRILAAQNAQNEEFSDDEDESRQGKSRSGASNRPEEVTSSPVVSKTPRLKSETRSQAPGRQTREVSMVPNSQVQDLVREGRGRPSSSAASEVVDLDDGEEDEGDEEDE